MCQCEDCFSSLFMHKGIGDARHQHPMSPGIYLDVGGGVPHVTQITGQWYIQGSQEGGCWVGGMAQWLEALAM